MMCSFDDDLGTVLNFYWSQSEHDQPDRSDTVVLLAYVESSDTWVDNTNGLMSAAMDVPNLTSTLTIHSANLTINEKKYWCIIQLRSMFLAESANAFVSGK